MEPQTRTEKKKQGKKDMGPYSAKHVRLQEALIAKHNNAEKRPEDKKPAK